MNFKVYLICDECMCGELRLDYREYQVEEDEVKIIDHFTCAYCKRYVRIPLERNIDEVAAAIEGQA